MPLCYSFSSPLYVSMICCAFSSMWLNFLLLQNSTKFIQFDCGVRSWLIQANFQNKSAKFRMESRTKHLYKTFFCFSFFLKKKKQKFKNKRSLPTSNSTSRLFMSHARFHKIIFENTIKLLLFSFPTQFNFKHLLKSFCGSYFENFTQNRICHTIFL